MVRLSAHAAARLAQRGIARDWVEAAILSPERQAPDPSDPRLIRAYRAIEAAGNRILRVVFRPDGEDILVITAFFDRDADP